MPEPRDPPPTEEGWYALHDFRRIDWDAWRDAPEREREVALAEGIEHLESKLAVEDAEEGDSALYSVLGHDADLLVVHLRPTSAHIGALERSFEHTALAAFTERVDSFVSVTEASGYSERAREYLEGELDEDSGLANYMQTRLYPDIPDATHVCFYPMDKRREPEQNWYDLPFEERAEHMDAHGDIGRDYGGQVVQMITGSIALEDWEWGVTLWGDELTDMKDLLYEMRFDPSTSQFAEFGPFFIGRRFPPADLPALLAGEPVPSDGETTELDRPVHPAGESGEGGDHAGRADGVEVVAGADGPGTNGGAHADGDASADSGGGERATDGSGETDHEGGGSAAEDESDGAVAEDESDEPSDDGGGMPSGEVPDDVVTVEDDDMSTRLGAIGLHEGEDYPAGTHGLVVYSTVDAKTLAEEVDELRGNFEHYDSHVKTKALADSGQSLVVSIWETERAAGIAEGFLTDLSRVSKSVTGPLGDPDELETDDGDGHAASSSEEMRTALDELDVYAGQPHGEDVYALVLYSDAELDGLLEETEEMTSVFESHDTHEGTAVYTDRTGGPAAVVSLWATERAASIAGDHLSDLPGVVGWADEGEGFGTMGMFYTVKPDHREEFVEKFDTVGEVLGEMEGHRESALLVNTEDENDMFIASRWDSKDHAMEFFRSDEFTDTVSWGRDILADRPRHVFLA